MPPRLSTRQSPVPPSRVSRRAVRTHPIPTLASPDVVAFQLRTWFNPMVSTLPLLLHSILTTTAEEVTEAVKQATPNTTGEAKGQANEMAGQAKGKANEVAGQAKGKAAELQGEANKKM
jgi:uncharacterized protein YjbJ (UPF0337 family)